MARKCDLKGCNENLKLLGQDSYYYSLPKEGYQSQGQVLVGVGLWVWIKSRARISLVILQPC